MTSRVAIALYALLCTASLAIAAEPAAPENGAPDPESEMEVQSPPNPKGQADPSSSAAQPETVDPPVPPANVQRHRPGACPEGPPCKEE